MLCLLGTRKILTLSTESPSRVADGTGHCYPVSAPPASRLGNLIDFFLQHSIAPKLSSKQHHSSILEAESLSESTSKTCASRLRKPRAPWTARFFHFRSRLFNNVRGFASERADSGVLHRVHHCSLNVTLVNIFSKKKIVARGSYVPRAYTSHGATCDTKLRRGLYCACTPA